MHKTQIKHKLPKTQNTNPFVLSRVCVPILFAKSRILDKVGTFGLYLCFGSCALCFTSYA